MSFEGLLSVSTNSSALCHESFSRASDPSFSSCFLPACFVCPHKDFRSTSKDVSSIFDRWLWYVAMGGVQTCRTRQGPSVHWVSHHGFTSSSRVHERSMHDPTFAHLSSTLQRVGLALGSTRMSNGRGRVACVRFSTLPTHREPAWGRHLSTGVAEGMDASGRDDPSWKFLDRRIMHGTDLGRSFFFPVFLSVAGTRTFPAASTTPRRKPGWEDIHTGQWDGKNPCQHRPRQRQGKGQRMRCPSLTPKHRSVAPEWCPLPTPPPPYHPAKEEEKKRDPASSSIPPIPALPKDIGRIPVDRILLLHACTTTTMSHPHEWGNKMERTGKTRNEGMENTDERSKLTNYTLHNPHVGGLEANPHTVHFQELSRANRSIVDVRGKANNANKNVFN